MHKQLSLCQTALAVQQPPQVAEGSECVLVLETEDTLTSSLKYGDLLLEQGKPVPAERVFRGALARARETLEGDHRLKLALISCLARSLRDQHRLEEAQPLALEDLEASRRSLGSSHPDTLASICSYAQLLQARGRLAEAEPLYREAVATSRHVQPGHPSTMTRIFNLADLLEEQGRLDEAEGLYREALAGFQLTLGAAHAGTCDAAVALERVLRAKAAAARQGGARPPRA